MQGDILGDQCERREAGRTRYKQKMLDGHKNIDAVTNAIDKIAD